MKPLQDEPQTPENRALARAVFGLPPTNEPPAPQFTDDDWLTPPALLELFGAFDLDPCAPLNRPWDTALNHYTIHDNGLKQPWTGRVWMNPPFSNMEAWIDKMTAHANGMALVNARTETKWFFRGIWDAAYAVFFFKSRIKFVRPDGQESATGKMGQAVAAYTEADAAILYRANLEGKFVPLIVKYASNVKTSWRKLVRFLIRECNGIATLDQLYGMAMGHPKTAANSNWKAKIRQQVQKEARRIGPALYELSPELIFKAIQ